MKLKKRWIVSVNKMSMIIFLTSFPSPPPSVGRPWWTMYSASTTPTVLVRLPCPE